MADNPKKPPRFLPRKEAAAYCAVSKSHLATLAMKGGGPPYSKLGRRKVVYDVDLLEQWMATHRQDNTASQAPPH